METFLAAKQDHAFLKHLFNYETSQQTERVSFFVCFFAQSVHIKLTRLELKIGQSVVLHLSEEPEQRTHC